MKNAMDICPPGAQRWQGVLDGACRLIAARELKNRPLWKKFVNEYRAMRDGERNAWAGEYWGKMLRGACITFRYTADEELYDALRETVEDMLSARDPLGRFSTYTVDTEFRGWDMWCRKYVLLAMEYFLDICPDEALKDKIVGACKRHADYILQKIGPAEGQLPIGDTSDFWGALNSSSILEPMVRLYGVTGEARYLDFARYIIREGGCAHCDIFRQAAENKKRPFEYGVTKAYEMISCFEGILEYYKITGEKEYLTMAENFFRAMEESDLTVTGCCGTEGELLNNSSSAQTDPLITGIMQENCVSVTWMKFAAKLLAVTGDPRYADRMEQTAYNALLSAVNLPSAEHPFDSYGALLFSHRGRGRGGYQPLDAGGSYGCCECIGSAGTGLMPLAAVMAGGAGCYVNFYEKGSAQLPWGDLQTETGYPADGRIKITVNSDKRFALRLRIPGWCRRCSLSVNGNAAAAVPGKWAVLDRQWERGDTVLLSLDMDVVPVKARPGRIEVCERHTALRRGPLVLARDARMGGDILQPCRPALRDGAAIAEPCREPAFPCMAAVEVKDENGGFFPMADYASCGKTLDEASFMTCWLPEIDYLTPEKERFRIVCDTGALAFDQNKKAVLKPEGALFEASAAGEGYYRLRSEDGYLSISRGELVSEKERAGENRLFRLVSDLAGKRYIVCKESSSLPGVDENGRVVCSRALFKWTLK